MKSNSAQKTFKNVQTFKNVPTLSVAYEVSSEVQKLSSEAKFKDM